MRRSHFDRAGLVYVIDSDATGRQILIASDNAPAALVRAAGQVRPVFRSAELQRLVAMRPAPATLRAVCDIKEVFPEARIASSGHSGAGGRG